MKVTVRIFKYSRVIEDDTYEVSVESLDEFTNEKSEYFYKKYASNGMSARVVNNGRELRELRGYHKMVIVIADETAS